MSRPTRLLVALGLLALLAAWPSTTRADAVSIERCFPFYHRCLGARHHCGDPGCHFTPGECAVTPLRGSAPSAGWVLVGLVLVARSRRRSLVHARRGTLTS
jgi:hypothetical protein